MMTKFEILPLNLCMKETKFKVNLILFWCGVAPHFFTYRENCLDIQICLKYIIYSNVRTLTNRSIKYKPSLQCSG